MILDIISIILLMVAFCGVYYLFRNQRVYHMFRRILDDLELRMDVEDPEVVYRRLEIVSAASYDNALFSFRRLSVIEDELRAEVFGEL